MKTTDFLKLTDGVDEKYLAETVRTGMTARGKANTAESASDAKSTEVFTMTNTSSRFSFLRPVFAGILTVVAAGGAAAWFFIGLPKLRQNPGTNPGESSTAVTLPDLSAFGIDTAQYVRAAEPYVGHVDFGGSEDVQADAAYAWCYEGPRPSEEWVRFDAGTADMLVLDQKGRLRRFTRSYRASNDTEPDFNAAVESAHAFAAAVIDGTAPQITVGEQGSTDFWYSGSFDSDAVWGSIELDKKGNVVSWYADYANMDGKTADTAEFDRAAANLLDTLAVGQLMSGDKWQITARRFISLGGRVYGLYDVLMGRGEAQEVAYGTYYFMIDTNGAVKAPAESTGTVKEPAESTDTAIQPADLAGLGIDMAAYQKNDAPYSYTTLGYHNPGGDTQLPSSYFWDYPYAQPHELWDEYRGANGEQLVLDQQGNLRRFSSGSEIPESKAPLSEKELKARGEALLQALLPGSNVSAEHYSFTVGYQVAWEESDGSVYRIGTIYLNTSGDIWRIINDCYVLQNVTDTGKYDQSAYRLSATALDPAVPGDSVEITDRFFISFAGKIYGCYTLERAADTGIYVNYEIIDIQGEGQSGATPPAGTESAETSAETQFSGGWENAEPIPAGAELPDISKYDFSEYGIDVSALKPDCYITVNGTQEKRVAWSSQDGSVFLTADSAGRVRTMGVMRKEDQPACSGFLQRAEALFRKLEPGFDPAVTENSYDGRWSYNAARMDEAGGIDIFTAEFYSDGTVCFVQADYAVQ